jgi:hypothetical protein
MSTNEGQEKPGGIRQNTGAPQPPPLPPPSGEQTPPAQPQDFSAIDNRPKIKFRRMANVPTPTYIYAEPQQAQVSATGQFEIDVVVQAIGFIIYNNLNSCWLSESDRRNTMAESFNVVTTALERFNEIRFTVSEEELKINGELYELNNQKSKTFATHLSEIGANNFTLIKGFARKEFDELIALMIKRPDEMGAEDAFSAAINAGGFQNVKCRKVVLREVSEEETIVAKAELEQMTTTEREKLENDVLALLTDSDKDKRTEQITSIRQMSEDSGKMANLIMQTVGNQLPEGMAKDKTKTAEMVVGCLDRAFAALLDDPFSKTQKGKKAIARALENLEKELLGKLEAKPEDAESHEVTSAVERMTERLKMDSIVQDYTRKLKSLEDSEKKILRFMKVQGLERIKDADLQKKLNDEGVDITGWHSLLAKSGTRKAGETDAEENTEQAINQLAELLGKLQEDTKPEADGKPLEEKKKKIADEIQQVISKVDKVTQGTLSKIDNLVEAVTADMGTIDALEEQATQQGKAPRLTRRKMIEVLAEVVQEICQPLAVVNCAVSMLSTNTLGQVAPQQVEMLNLAADGLARIRMLVDHLEKLAGMPTTLRPDTDIQRSLYSA